MPILGALGTAGALVLSAIAPTMAYAAPAAPAAVVATASNGEVAPADLDICLDGFDTCFFDEAAAVPVWELARTGIEFSGGGFAPGATVTASIGSTTVSEMTADENGSVEGYLIAEVAPGEHTVTLSADGESVSDTFAAVDDGEWWADHDAEPYSSASRSVVTVSELAEEPVEFFVTDYPYMTPVDVYIGGEFIETVQHAYHFTYEVSGAYEPGELVVEFQHPTATLSDVITVVPDERGAWPHAGDYVGTSLQTHSGGIELDVDDEGYEPEHRTRAFSFSIDENGALVDIAGEFWWVCIGVEGYIDSDSHDFAYDADLLTAELTVDQPFEINTGDEAVFDYQFNGVVRSDGTASHDLCGHGSMRLQPARLDRGARR